MSEKRRLGRGLDSLIPALEETAAAPAGVVGIQEIPLKKIELNPDQPRLDINPEELARLAESIRSSGVIQPVMVRPAGEMFELVVGERRVRAARMAGLAAVPALIRAVPDEKMLELALIENIHRSDLNAIEKAKAIRRLTDTRGITHEEAARRLGLDRSTVSNMLRLLELPEEVQLMVSRGTLSAGHARAVLAVEDEAARTRLAHRIAQSAMSVREAEHLAAANGGMRRVARLRPASPNIVHLEESLSQALGAKTEIRQKRKGGKIVIHFTDLQDFELLYELLTGRIAAEYVHKASA